MFIVIIVFSTIVAYNEYRNFEIEAESIQAEFIQKQKDTIVFDTMRVLDFISKTYEENIKLEDETLLKKQILG